MVAYLFLGAANTRIQGFFEKIQVSMRILQSSPLKGRLFLQQQRFGVIFIENHFCIYLGKKIYIYSKVKLMMNPGVL